MRFAWPVLFASTLAAASGHVMKIPDHGSREVYIPAGTFVMGISKVNDESTMLEQQCELSFMQTDARLMVTPNGEPETFCAIYQKVLEATSDTLFDDDGKAHPRTVYLGAYAIDRDEVTVDDYRACVKRGGCSLDPLITGDDRYIGSKLPLVNVTWFEAQDYCRWRGGRLPTEAEWERAARGDDDRSWPWGGKQRELDFNHGKPRDVAMREVDRVAFVGVPTMFIGDPDDTDGTAILAPPGTYPWGEGAYGTRDQAGNVAEWTSDAFTGISSQLAVDDKRLGYNNLSAIDPHRDGTSSDPRVVRGGSWRQPSWLGRANVRDPFNMLYVPDGRFSHIGFRCARST
ncbi:MAG: formylglycine-generating enzyme family protein [Kofleriaceae bacterium]